MTETEWPMMSCSSRAMRARSSRTALVDSWAARLRTKRPAPQAAARKKLRIAPSLGSAVPS